MKRNWWLALLLVFLTSCVTPDLPHTTDTPQTGCVPVPDWFLNAWYSEQLPQDQISIPSIEAKAVVDAQAIKRAQIVMTSPIVTELPSRYIQPHTPVRNQGANGTCWQFQTVGQLESAMLVQSHQNADFAEQYVAYYNIDFWTQTPPYPYRLLCQETNEDIGGNPFFACYNVIRRGIPTESQFPYIAERQQYIKWTQTTDLSELYRPRAMISVPPYTQFADYDTYIRTIKSVIKTHGAVTVIYAVYSDFASLTEAVYIKRSNQFVGYHAVLLVGWVDNFHSPSYSGPIWIAKNSWGKYWGKSLSTWGFEGNTNGYFAVPMIDEQEFNTRTCPNWKFEARDMHTFQLP